jgi:methylated-DNA-[protein]-cysteine S-methyltransferase
MRIFGKDHAEIARIETHVRVSGDATGAAACYITGMTNNGYTIYDTAIGRCGIAWNAHGVIVAAGLPEADDDKLRVRLLRRCPGAIEQAPPPAVRRAIDGVVALIAGRTTDDLSDVALDMDSVPAFNRRIYEITRAIPPGSTLTYGEIATRLGGGPELARDVGTAMGQNPVAPIVPCHRVVAAGRKAGGFSARGGVTTKLKLLAIEGAEVEGTLPLFDRARQNSR